LLQNKSNVMQARANARLESKVDEILTNLKEIKMRMNLIEDKFN